MTDFLLMMGFLAVNVFCGYKVFQTIVLEEAKQQAKMNRLLSQVAPMEPMIKMVQNEMIIEMKDIAEPKSDHSYEVWLPQSQYKIVTVEASNADEAIARAQLGEGEVINTVSFDTYFEPKVIRSKPLKDADEDAA